MWLLVVFTYALFIPNDWRRAAVVLTVVALAPVLTSLYTAVLNPQVMEAMLARPERGVASILELAIASVTAVWGVYTINHLQHEAYQARQIGQYKLKELLGAGGMGEVYLAEHQMLKRPCAIKLVAPERAGDARALAKFEREVRTTARLSHPNTVEIYDYGRTDEGTFYYVMELLGGLSLADLVELLALVSVLPLALWAAGLVDRAMALLA